MKKFLLVTFVAAPTALVVAGVVYQQWAIRRDRRRFAAPGRLVSSGRRSLHVYQTGDGKPAIVLEAGLASSSLSWALVQEQLSKRTRVTSYDRSGIGWSEETGRTRTVENIVGELASVLEHSGTQPPYILIGHSFGGLLVRAYAHLRPNEVVGLILVDPVSPQFWAECSARDLGRLQLGAKLSRRGAWLANLGIVRLALTILVSGNTWMPKLISRMSASRASGMLSRLVGVVQKLPPELWPAVQSHWSHAKSFRAMAESLETLPGCALAVRELTLDPRTPVIVLSASDTTPAELEEREGWARNSQKGKHIRIPDCTHWIQLEQPNEVVAAALELLDQVRSRDLTEPFPSLSN